MLTPIRPTQLAVERRRGEVASAAQVQGQNFKVVYFFDVDGAGQTLVDVNFPVLFQERPALTHGGEVADGTVLEDGKFPTCSAMVVSYTTQVRNGTTYYAGCRAAVVVTGGSRQRATVHLHVEGKALQGPVT
jgi:hypothetical protein